MKLVIQRVTEASVTVENKIIGQIGTGYLVLLGVGQEDTEETVRRLADKLVKLRIFSDGRRGLGAGDLPVYALCRLPVEPSGLFQGGSTRPCRASVRTIYRVSAGKRHPDRARQLRGGYAGAALQRRTVHDLTGGLTGCRSKMRNGTTVSWIRSS